MRNPLLVPELRELLRLGKSDEIRELIEDLHPKDAASILSGLMDSEIVSIMSLLPLDVERDLFIYFEPEVQEGIVIGSGRNRVKALLTALPSDERAEFLDELDERVRAQLVPLLAKTIQQDLVRRDQFEDDQVGAILSTEYCVLNKERTSDSAIAELRRQSPTRETIYYSYVIDQQGKLIGFVSLRDLVVAPDGMRVEEIMRLDPVAVQSHADQEEAARLIRDYDLLALPVIDSENRLIGIVTHDDAADILQAEDTEDIEKMAGIASEPETQKSYSEHSFLSEIKRRSPVIVSLAIFFAVTSSVIQSVEHKLELIDVSIIVAMMPMVMAIGGMVGTQASSLIIRALTTGDLNSSLVMPVLWKEIRIATGMAAILSAIAFTEALVINAFTADPAATVESTDKVMVISIAIGIAMFLHVVTTALFGTMVPIITKRMKRDPAMISTPVVTGVADLSGVTLYVISILIANAYWL